MGGWKNSGIGVRHGAQGIRRFCHTEAVTIPRLPTAKSEPVWFPYSARKRGVRPPHLPLPQRPRAAQPAARLSTDAPPAG